MVSATSIDKAHNDEEQKFWKTLSFKNQSALPSDENYISSHTIYKIEVNDDNALKLKARISPHGN